MATVVGLPGGPSPLIPPVGGREGGSLSLLEVMALGIL